MVEVHFFSFSCDLRQSYGLGSLTAGGDHDAEDAVMNKLGADLAKSRGKKAIHCRGSAAALDITKDGDARFEAGEFFEEMGQAQGVARVLAIEFRQFSFGLQE